VRGSEKKQFNASLELFLLTDSKGWKKSSDSKSENLHSVENDFGCEIKALIR
jgi:hypothetical protein